MSMKAMIDSLLSHGVKSGAVRVWWLRLQTERVFCTNPLLVKEL